MLIPGRHYNSEKYRFAFNGKESDPEWKGTTGAVYDYGFRIYDARIAKFLSVDPLTKDYPWYTPYQFAGNKPIWAIDLEGLEEAVTTLKNYSNSEPVLDVIWDEKAAPLPYNQRWLEIQNYDDDGYMVSGSRKRMAYQHYDAAIQHASNYSNFKLESDGKYWHFASSIDGSETEYGSNYDNWIDPLPYKVIQAGFRAQGSIFNIGIGLETGFTNDTKGTRIHISLEHVAIYDYSVGAFYRLNESSAPSFNARSLEEWSSSTNVAAGPLDVGSGGGINRPSGNFDEYIKPKQKFRSMSIGVSLGSKLGFTKNVGYTWMTNPIIKSSSSEEDNSNCDGQNSVSP